MFRHEIDDGQSDVESEYLVVPIVGQFHPCVDVLDRTVEGCQRCQGQRTLAILLTDSTTDELVGGLWARSLWGSLFVDIMFVPDTLPGNGIGTSLLRQAEQEAIRRGCRNLWTETYAFQARPFYEKLGF